MAAKSRKKPSDGEGKAATKARPAKPVARTSNGKRRRESTPDPERDEARNFFHNAGTRMGRKKPGAMSAAAAKEAVQSKAVAIRASIISGSASDSGRQGTSSVYSNTQRDSLGIADKLTTKDQGVPNVWNEAQEFLGKCRGTVQEYISLGNKPTDIHENIDRSRWVQDTKDLTELNTQAFSLAVKCVERGLIPNVNPVMTPPHRRAGTRCPTFAPLAWEMLEEARPTDGVITWGSVASEALQSLIALAKTSSPDTNVHLSQRIGRRSR